VPEVTIDGLISRGGSELEFKRTWWHGVDNSWNGDGFVVVGSYESGVDFLFSGGISVIDIEPLTIYVGGFEIN